MIKKVVIAALVLAAAIVGFELGSSVGETPFSIGQPKPPVVVNPPATVDFSQFWDVWRRVHDEFYEKDKLNDGAMVYGAIQGMVKASGDKYGEFFTPEETKNFTDTIAGSFDGIGAEIGLKNGQIIIVAPLKGTPAEAAGVKPGDYILKVDDESTFEMSLERAVTLIKGPRGTKVRLTVSRKEAEQPLEIEITRARIDVPAIDSKMRPAEPGVGLIEIRTFTDTAPANFRKAVQALKRQGLQRLVIDLRNDPGGVLEAAVAIGSVFTGPDKVIAIEKQREGEPKEHKTLDNALLGGVPVVLVVNEGTASAAEILAGALRDHLGTPIIGQPTFGKGSVQSYEPLDNGASLKITTAHWFTPKGDSIEGAGLKPDIEVVNDEAVPDVDAQLLKALEVLKAL